MSRRNASIAEFMRPGLAPLVAVAILSTSCGGGGDARTIPVTPMCTILCEVSSTDVISWNGRVFVADRTDPAVDHNFTAFRAMSGPRQALGNPEITGTATGLPNAYAVSEAWLRSATPKVHRALATPAKRRGVERDNLGSAWQIVAQDATGAWSSVFGTGSANPGTDPPLVLSDLVSRSTSLKGRVSSPASTQNRLNDADAFAALALEEAPRQSGGRSWGQEPVRGRSRRGHPGT